MSLVGSRLSLIHRCTIERAANAASLDSWNTPDPPDWQPHLEGVPCRSWVTAGREIVTDKSTLTVVEDARLIVSLGTDVTEGDRIASVTYRGGTIQDGPLGIRAVLAHRDHIELVLAKVS